MTAEKKGNVFLRRDDRPGRIDASVTPLTRRARQPRIGARRAIVYYGAKRKSTRPERPVDVPVFPARAKPPILDAMLAIPFALIGAGAFVVGVILLRRGITVRLRGTLVDAEVVHRDVYEVSVAEKRSPGSLGGGTVRPHFRYRTADGRELTARLDHQTRQRLRSEGYRLRYPLGARVRVRIDPGRPDVAYEDAIGGLLVFPALLLLAGLLMTLLALGITFGSSNS